jgi:hypothetical protein
VSEQSERTKGDKNYDLRAERVKGEKLRSKKFYFAKNHPQEKPVLK